MVSFTFTFRRSELIFCLLLQFVRDFLSNFVLFVSIKETREKQQVFSLSFVTWILRNSVTWDSQFRWIKIDIIWCYHNANVVCNTNELEISHSFIQTNLLKFIDEWHFFLHEKCTHVAWVCVYVCVFYEIWSDLFVFHFSYYGGDVFGFTTKT